MFIPCRTVLEMEAIISLYLLNSNYDKIKDIPDSRPSSDRLIDILAVRDQQLFVDIIDFFINRAIPKVKPVVMYAREHHERFRMGNVAPYAKTRVCVYLALHRLKLKFLIIKNFIDTFKSNNYNLDSFYENEIEEDMTFLAALSKDYYKKNKMNLRLMIQKRRVSERVQKLLNDKDAITSEKLFKMATFKVYLERANIIKFIMREIKASIFVCKLMFAKMDLHNPFSFTEETALDLEEIMISNDFIPELLPAISKSLRTNNITQLEECINAFDFLMDKVLNGINKAIEITSGGQFQIGLYETIYDTGNIFAF
ncbi:MAG: hypothetical protein ACFFDK_14395 [Promethearchaeota archaeon]